LRSGLRETAAAAVFDPSSPCRDLLDTGELKRVWSEHQTGLRDHSVLLWGVMMFGLWHQQRQSRYG
jgi:asparagine synthase (glutamine-hydrolysing)